MTLTAKVRFGDIVKDVPAHIEMLDGFIAANIPHQKIVPDQIKGYYFHEVYDTDCQWVAIPSRY